MDPITLQARVEGPAVLAFQAAGDAPGAQAWESILEALEYWPSPACLGVERRLTRVGRRVVEHVLVTSDGVGVLDGEEQQLTELLRPLRQQVALRPAPVPTSVKHSRALLAEVGRRPVAVDESRLAALVEELAGLPPGAGLSVRARCVARDHTDDDRARVRFRSPFPGTEVELVPVARPRLDAAVLLWSPTALPPVLLARAGAAFGHHSVPGDTTPERDSDDPVAVPGRLAALLGSPGLTPPDRSKRARLGRPHTVALPKHGASLGRVLTPAGATKEFRLPWEQRRRHLFLCGRTGSGKSELLVRLVADDLANGRTVVVIDPHGDLADRALALVPADRRKDVVLIDPAHERTAAIPVLAPRASTAARAAALDHALSEALDEGRNLFSSRMRRPARLAMEVLEELSGVDPTLTTVDRLLVDAEVRGGLQVALRSSRLARRMSGTDRSYWDHGTSRGTIFNQTAGRCAFDHVPRWDLATSLNASGIVLAKIDQAALGTVDAGRFGRILLSLIHQETARFARVPANERPELSIIIDEAHLFTSSPVLGSMLAQLRKFGAALTIASQAPSRLGGLLPDVLTNCATVLAMQLPAKEASAFRDRGGEELADRIAALPKYHAAMLLDDDEDPSPVILHPSPLLADDPEAREATLTAAQAAHGRRPENAARGDLERFADLADALGYRQSYLGRREVAVDPDTIEALVAATLAGEPLPPTTSLAAAAPC